MSLAVAATHQLGVLVGVRRSDSGTEVEFADAPPVRLDGSRADFRDLFDAAERIARWASHRRPVGATVGPDGFLLDLDDARDSAVDWLKDSPTNPDAVVRVTLWSSCAVFALAKDHPEFDRIHSVLAESAATGRVLWVACHSQERIADADEHGDVGEYFQILDARPINPLADPAAPLPPAPRLG